MAFLYSDYKKRAENIIEEIIKEYSLIQYHKRNNKKNIEDIRYVISGKIFNLSRLSIKGIDDSKTRLKVLNEIWGEKHYNNSDVIYEIIKDFFIEKGIEINSEEYDEIIKSCIQIKDNLFNTIVSRDVIKLIKYIETF